MEEWRLLMLGALDGYRIQTAYEAVAWGVSKGLAPNTLNICWPSSPYVCIGIHQLPELEVDLEFCKRVGVPVVKRQVGGGAVWLDENQVFYHVIVHKDHELARGTPADFFKKLLKVIVKFYRSYGIPAEYKPVNDVVVHGKKISGNGAARLYDAMVLIGNVILNFNAEMASKVLRVPSEKMRDKVFKTMQEWVSSMKGELGYIPPRDEIVRRLIECFEDALRIRLVKGELTAEEKSVWEGLVEKFKSPSWMYGGFYDKQSLLEGYAPGTRIVKIREGHFILFVDYKALKTVRFIIEVVDGVIEKALISGDFFVEPPKALDAIAGGLEGLRITSDQVEDSVIESFKRNVKSSAGLKAEDLICVIRKAREVFSKATGR
ncbi:MAG: lipoate--protein ligase family protein [Thermoprotei archaeon]|nr:lipoate--protein ligase family protein [Thermoprotei archaeon]